MSAINYKSAQNVFVCVYGRTLKIIQIYSTQVTYCNWSSFVVVVRYNGFPTEDLIVFVLFLIDIKVFCFQWKFLLFSFCFLLRSSIKKGLPLFSTVSVYYFFSKFCARDFSKSIPPISTSDR